MRVQSSVLIFVALFTTGCQPASRQFPVAAAGQRDPVVDEINAMRSDPSAYAAKLQSRRAFYSGLTLRLPGQPGIRTQEGAAALDEAVSALRASSGLPALAASDPLSKSARDHARDIGPKGLIAHEGSDGSSPRTRMSRYARGLKATAEVISFGPTAPESVVIDLLVDDGVASRGHRKILLDPRYRIAGSACEPHATYRQVCVVDLADGG